MSLDLGKATNKGTAMLKLAHQFQPEVILSDQYVGWFFDSSTIQYLQEDGLKLTVKPANDIQRFLHIAYWYIVLREKHGDEVITQAISAGCRQLLLLGAGYDTRLLRLAALQNRGVTTFEVDLSETIEQKQRYLIDGLGHIPKRLTLIPFDFNQDQLNRLADYGFDQNLATAYIWQGVSYYLPQATVSQVLDFIKTQMTPGSVLVFDCCSPLMTVKNDRIPGIGASIDRLSEIGEPYLFGMTSDEMKAWLQEKGFQEIEILQQNDLEARFLHRQTIPNNMWYVVVARV